MIYTLSYPNLSREVSCIERCPDWRNSTTHTNTIKYAIGSREYTDHNQCVSTVTIMASHVFKTILTLSSANSPNSPTTDLTGGQVTQHPATVTSHSALTTPQTMASPIQISHESSLAPTVMQSPSQDVTALSQMTSSHSAIGSPPTSQGVPPGDTTSLPQTSSDPVWRISSSSPATGNSSTTMFPNSSSNDSTLTLTSLTSSPVHLSSAPSHQIQTTPRRRTLPHLSASGGGPITHRTVTSTSLTTNMTLSSTQETSTLVTGSNADNRSIGQTTANFTNVTNTPPFFDNDGKRYIY